MNQMNHQESGADNLQQINSNPGPLLPTLALWFQISRGRLNHHDIDNGDVKVQTSYFLVEFNYKSVPDLDTTPIKSIDDDEMDYLLELFHSEHDEDLLDVELHILQY